MRAKFSTLILFIATILILSCGAKKPTEISNTLSSTHQSHKKARVTNLDEDIPTDDEDNVMIDAADAFVGITKRNYPNYVSQNKPNSDFVIKPCRKKKPEPIILPIDYKAYFSKLKDPIEISFDKLSNDDKIHLCKLAIETKEPKYFELMVKLINSKLDPNQAADVSLVKCLGYFKNELSKKTLLELLKHEEPSISTIAAICLVQIDVFDDAIEYFDKKYYYQDDFAKYTEYVNSTLMYINTSKSKELLKKFTEHQANPGYVLDGLAALALLGECEYAFEGFKKLLNSSQEMIREKSISCLAYYIGTPQAFKLIEIYKNDESIKVSKEAEHVLNLYKAQSR